MTQQQQQQSAVAEGSSLDRRLNELATGVTKLETVVEKLADAQKKQQEYIDALGHRINQPKDWVSIAGLAAVLIGGGVSFTLLMTSPLQRQGDQNELAIAGIQEVLRERAAFIGQDSARIEALMGSTQRHEVRLDEVAKREAYAAGRMDVLETLIRQKLIIDSEDP